MLRLVKQWLKAPVETTDGGGKRRMEGGKASMYGVPQGGVISPLIANIYMNRFLKHWRQSGRGEAWQAHIINYADDFVILSRGYAADALAWTDRVMTRPRLRRDKPGADPEPNENPTVRCTGGTVRLPGLQLWPALLPPDWAVVYGSQPVEQERAASEGQGG